MIIKKNITVKPLHISNCKTDRKMQVPKTGGGGGPKIAGPFFKVKKNAGCPCRCQCFQDQPVWRVILNSGRIFRGNISTRIYSACWLMTGHSVKHAFNLIFFVFVLRACMVTGEKPATKIGLIFNTLHKIVFLNFGFDFTEIFIWKIWKHRLCSIIDTACIVKICILLHKRSFLLHFKTLKINRKSCRNYFCLVIRWPDELASRIKGGTNLVTLTLFSKSLFPDKFC